MRRLRLVFVASLVLLAGAGQAAQAKPALRILEHRPVDSPLYDALRHSLRGRLDVRPYDGSQRPSRFDVVVVDGDRHSPLALRRSRLLDRTFAAGRWLLLVDATPRHQRTGLARRVGATMARRTPALLVRRRDERGTLQIQAIQAAPHAPGTGRARETAAMVAAIRDVVRPAGARAAAAPPDSPIPSDLVHAQWQWSIPKVGQFDSSALVDSASTKPQYASNLVNHTFTLFLDNAGNAQGNFQYLLYQLDGETNPTSGTSQFIDMSKHEKAWWTAIVDASVQPDDSEGWTWVANAPSTPNPETTYTSGSSFTVGYWQSGENPQPNASYTWSSSTTHSIPSWGVTSNTSLDQVRWRFAAESPCDIAGGQDGCWSFWGNPTTPNALSVGQLPYAASAVWKTSEVMTDWVYFDTDVQVDLADLWCGTVFVGACESAARKSQLESVDAASTFSINLGAVVPVPILSVSFDPSPATAGEPVTGTITLARPAPTDITVVLSSNSQNATVLPSTTIETGETTGTFQVLTNANGLSPGQSTVATIDAFYADSSQAQLEVRVPAAPEVGIDPVPAPVTPPAPLPLPVPVTPSPSPVTPPAG